jgi:hypothetical protein
MEAFIKQMQRPRLLNECRMFLRVTYLADIVDACGTPITQLA